MSSTRAAPSGRVRPCSQLRSVEGLIAKAPGETVLRQTRFLAYLCDVEIRHLDDGRHAFCLVAIEVRDRILHPSFDSSETPCSPCCCPFRLFRYFARALIACVSFARLFFSVSDKFAFSFFVKTAKIRIGSDSLPWK